MSKQAIPDIALSQHIAILGKTGSGKTSTEKLVVEHVVAEEYRVCILDSIKSDWWGITSSADGKKPGLPFKILGGPHGHVPLHSSAGAVIGQLVGSGKLPLSIIDMTDFEAGGLQRFFADFAPALMRSMKGVLYLVIEEAHEFAPKERSGFGAENMAIHWAKKLATAGRSKGIRLIVATQRVQSLHNAVLGSCETLIAHRLTTPADQEPILKWLKANTDKEITEKVARSLSSLPTGTGWLCSGEAKIFEEVKFPKFKTFDNAATPTKDGEEIHVKTAPVDQEELKAIIGDAIVEVEGNDPKHLRKRIIQLESELRKKPGASDQELIKARDAGIDAGRLAGGDEMLNRIISKLKEIPGLEKHEKPQIKITERPKPVIVERSKLAEILRPISDVKLATAERKFLTALAQRKSALTRNKIAIFTGYSVKSGHIDNTLGALRSRGLVAGGNDAVKITNDGMAALGSFEPLPTGETLRNFWISQMDKAGASFLKVLIDIYPNGLTRNELAGRAGYSPASGHVDNTLGKLRSFELAEGSNDFIKASDDLFQEAA